MRAPSLPAAAWLASRGAIALSGAFGPGADLAVYFGQAHRWLLGEVPYRDFSAEYPPAAEALFAVLGATGSYAAFRVAATVVLLAADAATTRALLRAGRNDHRSETAVWLYLLATTLLFPVLLLRFDLLPASAVAAAACLLSGRRGSAPPGTGASAEPPLSARRALAIGTLLGLGAALKLYALVLVPIALAAAWRAGGRPAARAMVGAFLAAALLPAAPALLAGAGQHVTWFLDYQAERGLQIESTASSILLAVNLVVPLDLGRSEHHHATHLAGEAARLALLVARPVQVLAPLGALALALRRRLVVTTALAAVLATTVVTATILSPQFLLWLCPLVALAAPGLRSPEAALLVGACGLTTVLYPFLYGDLVAGGAAGVLVLLARNLLLGTLAIRLVARPPRS